MTKRILDLFVPRESKLCSHRGVRAHQELAVAEQERIADHAQRVAWAAIAQTRRRLVRKRTLDIPYSLLKAEPTRE